MQQKRLHGCGLQREHLLAEVIQHEAMTAGKGGQKRGDIAPPLQRERGKLQADHPSFCATLEGSNGPSLQVEFHHLTQKRADLIGGKAQIGSTHLGELSAGPQPCKQERWISTRGNDEVHVGWQVLKQEEQGTVDGLGTDDVIVIQHQGEVSRSTGHELVDYQGNDALKWRWARGLQ